MLASFTASRRLQLLAATSKFEAKRREARTTATSTCLFSPATNPPQTLQVLLDMGFWDKSLRVFKYLCDHGRQSVRCMARQTGLSKSSVHRLQHAMERRNGHPESWLWETEVGRQWLTRLVVATLYTFGLKRGVGMETMHTFF